MSQIIYESIKNYEHIIWDWNGTLFDDIDLVFDIINDILKEYNLPTPSLDEYKEHFGFPVEDYYKKLGFNFEKTPYTILADHFVKEYMARSHEGRLFPNTIEMLEKIQRQGIFQSILSASNQSHLDQLIDHFQIRKYFENICGIQNHYAYGKVERGLELIKQTKISQVKTVLVGDTDHDCEVGRTLGIDVLLLGTGHQSYQRLQKIHDWVLTER